MKFLVLQLLLIGGPLYCLARFRRTYPGPLLVLLLVVPTLLCVPLLAMPSLMIAVLVADAVLAAVAIVDAFRLPRAGDFEVARELGQIASLRKKHEVQLLVSNRSDKRWFVSLKDGVPPELNPEPDSFFVPLEPRSRATVEYDIRPRRRGAFRLEKVFLRVPSRLHLWRRFIDYAVVSVLHVYPDMKQLAEYAVMARTNRLALLGVRRTRRIGQDHEFERLRDFTQDDNYRHIDWRTTARRNKLTVKDFQANQRQNLIFLVDCGRMMTNQAAGLSLLDHALNAMLMLSYVALDRGDSVGLISFSNQVHGFVPPRSGRSHMTRLLHASFDRFPKLVESRYDRAFLYLRSHCRKRSLVVFVTNLIDEVNANQIYAYLANMVGQHLPLGVLMRDRRLFDAVDVAPRPLPSEIFHAAAAAEILTWRQQILTDLTSRGVLALDVYPEEMTAPLINQYLDIKARHLL